VNAGSRLPRLVRGSTTAAVSTFVALLGHVAGGGEVPRVLGVAAPLVLSVLVCTLLAGRRPSLTRVVASVIAAQTLFHLLFSLGATRVGVAIAAEAAGHHHQQLAVASGPSLSATAHAHSAPAMLLGHALAAAVTVSMLVFSERLVESLVTLAKRFARWLADPFLPTTAAGGPRSLLAATGSAVGELRHLTDLSGASRRGPPLLAF
jgi:hypothetical protein